METPKSVVVFYSVNVYYNIFFTFLRPFNLFTIKHYCEILLIVIITAGEAGIVSPPTTCVET